MCLDATIKSKASSLKSQVKLQIQNIKSQFPEIIDVNESLLQMGISVLFISVKKDRKNHIKELNENIFKMISRVSSQMEEAISGLFVIYVEHTVDVSDIKDTMWRFANNFDPKRDSFMVTEGIGMDGTRKTKQYDNFDRPWPNIICADEETIKSVDEKWDKMFGHTPSLPFREGLKKVSPEGGDL